MLSAKRSIRKRLRASKNTVIVQAVLGIGLMLSLLGLQMPVVISIEDLVPSVFAATTEMKNTSWDAAAPILGESLIGALIDSTLKLDDAEYDRLWSEHNLNHIQRASTAASVLSSARIPLPPSVITEGSAIGHATYYAEPFHGRPMRNGEIYDMNDPTITASNTWPLGTKLRVTRLPGSPNERGVPGEVLEGLVGASIVVTVKDTGGFTHPLDLSRAAFSKLGQLQEGVIRVRVEIVNPQSS